MSTPRPRLSFGLTLTALLVAACGPENDPLDSAGTGVASQSGGTNNNTAGNSSNSSAGTEGGTEGMTEGGTEGTSSATQSTSPDPTTGGSGEHGACDQFLLCVSIVDPASLPMYEEAYGPNSSCWQTTPEIAQMCKDGCAAALDVYGLNYPDEPVCGGSGPSTSTSGPVTSTTDDWTTGTSDWTGTTFPETTSTTDPGTTTNGGGFGNCGWDGANGYYACGNVGEDPNGVNPIACPPELPLSGEACDDNGPINAIGCCTPEGDNYYCGGTIVIENCGP